VKPDAGHPGEPLLALLVEGVDAGGDVRAAELFVEGERLGERPAVLEGVEAAGRDP
jgi:hypothetical protein